MQDYFFLPDLDVVVHSSNLIRPRAISTGRSPIIGTTSSLSTQDDGLFFRLSHDNESPNLSPNSIHEVIIRKILISPPSIDYIKLVRSDFAWSPCNFQAREVLPQIAIRLSLLGVKLEPATNWTSIIISTVSKSICTIEGRLEVTKTVFDGEVERVTGKNPSTLKLYGHNRHEALHRTWMAFFTRAPRPGFHIFDESRIMRNFRKKLSIDFCNRCYGHLSSNILLKGAYLRKLWINNAC